MRTLKLGLIGLGQGAAAVLPTMASMSTIEVVAGADRDPLMRAAFRQRFAAAKVYDDAALLCADPEVDAVWIATPNRFHCAQAIEAARLGKHVAVEKPMALSMEEADRMVEAAAANGVKIIAVHTSSYGLPVRAMRRLALSGEIGPVRALNVTSYTDWMLRPRTADELDPEQGGGIVYRQGPHQTDTIRLLGGGLLSSVRASVGGWMSERPIAGFYSALFEFENGMSATVLHNGYGYFLTAEHFPWAIDSWRYSREDQIEMRRAIRSGSRDEEREKLEFRIGGRRDPTAQTHDRTRKPWTPWDLGMIVMSCERGDVRNSKYGLYVYDDNGCSDLDLSAFMPDEVDLEGGASVGALQELYNAVVLGRPIFHSGEWGRATLEATLAIAESAKTHKEVRLYRQVEMPLDYDADLDITGAPRVPAMA
jgi:phthalate 4,5-cis-dihydrodiol dehydrogenase